MPPKTGLGLVSLIVTLLLAGGCHGPYLVRQLAGGVHLIAAARPVEEALADDAVSPELRGALIEVQRVLEFAGAEGLDVGDAYGTFVDLGGRPPVYVLYASPPDRLEAVTWAFPLVGRFPYKGYFDLQSLRRERHELEKEGFETHAVPASAYSMLGWFPDPLFSSFLEEQPGSRAEILFHELTHRTVFIRGDVPFNESLATFVGQVLARRFLAREYGPESGELRDYEDRQHDRALFNEVMTSVQKELREAFESPDREVRLAARERILNGAKESFKARPFRSERFRRIADFDWNVPFVLSATIYHGRPELFQAALDHGGGSVAGFLGVMAELDGEPDTVTSLERWVRANVTTAPGV